MEQLGRASDVGNPVDQKAASEVLRNDSIRVKNRRRLYLERHPSYFTQPELELADPLLYDRCIRRFQSAAEREADGRAKGFSGSLEADLYRSEAKLAALAGNSTSDDTNSKHVASQQVSYVRGEDGQIVPEDPDEVPQDKEEGLERWKHEMALRFVRGDDPDFDYEDVDNNDALDSIEIMEAQDSWIDTESPQWVGDEDHTKGETGIQDF